MRKTNKICWTGDNWDEVFDFIYSKDTDMIAYGRESDLVTIWIDTENSGRLTVPVGETIYKDKQGKLTEK